ncbi:MAG: hypothetical protein H6826_13780 [Planctomycetes bacterium]|nr:hypothetical protein [Planctomycetota bacterium]
MSLAARLRAATRKAFTAAGDLVVLGTMRRVRTGDFDPVTGGPDRIVEEWREVECVVSAYRAAEIDGERVKATDRRVYLLATDTLPEPQPGDRIEIANEAFTVSRCETTRAGATALLYDCQAAT